MAERELISAPGGRLSRVSTTAPAWRDAVAPVLSALCFVHCVGMALLAPLLPGALAFLAGGRALEWSLVGASMALTGGLMWRSRRLLGAKLPLLAMVAAAGTIGGLACGSEWLQRLGLGSLAIAQIGVLVARGRAHRACRSKHRDERSTDDCCPPR
jgi:hypothetical protein